MDTLRATVALRPLRIPGLIPPAQSLLSTVSALPREIRHQDGAGGRAEEYPMRRLLERSIASVEERLVLLAPPQATIPASFTRLQANVDVHAHYNREVQQLRGHYAY